MKRTRPNQSADPNDAKKKNQSAGLLKAFLQELSPPNFRASLRRTAFTIDKKQHQLLRIIIIITFFFFRKQEL